MLENAAEAADGKGEGLKGVVNESEAAKSLEGGDERVDDEVEDPPSWLDSSSSGSDSTSSKMALMRKSDVGKIREGGGGSDTMESLLDSVDGCDIVEEVVITGATMSS